MISIRRRLLLGTVLTVALSSGAASIAVWAMVRAHLIATAEADIRSDAAMVLAQLRCREGRQFCLAQARGMPAPDGLWTVLDVSGATLLSSSPEAETLASLPDGPVMLAGERCVRIGRVQGAVRGAGGSQTVVVARDEARLSATLAAVAWALAGAVAGAALLAGAAAVLLARAVVRPIDRIAGAIAGTRPDDLRISVDPATVPRELRGVVDRADAFLTAAQHLLARERRTAADIAHELRTPLAGLAATIDLALSRERQPEDYRQALRRSRAVVDDTSRIVEQLLLLTRLEAGREPATRLAIDLGEALRSALAATTAEAGSREICLPEPAEAPPVRGDPGHLQLVLGNLLGNAVAHAPTAARVGLGVTVDGGLVSLRITNPAGGLGTPDLAHLGEPFWRGDQARGGTGRHAGLGLALCLRLCAINGWSLVFSIDGTDFAAVLALPAA